MTFNQALHLVDLTLYFHLTTTGKKEPCSSYFLLKPINTKINVKHSGHHEGQKERQGLCGQGCGIQISISHLFLPFDYFS